MKVFLPHTVGLEKVFDSITNMFDPLPDATTFPSYNIRKDGKDYVIEMSLAGFKKEDVKIELHDGVLSVTGGIAREGDFVHKGIPDKKFQRFFKLADALEVGEASLENGMLVIRLENKLPEISKPTEIAIK